MELAVDCAQQDPTVTSVPLTESEGELGSGVVEVGVMYARARKPTIENARIVAIQAPADVRT